MKLNSWWQTQHGKTDFPPYATRTFTPNPANPAGGSSFLLQWARQSSGETRSILKMKTAIILPNMSL